MSITNEVKLFTGTNSKYLSEKIAEAFGKPLGDLSISKFSDGEFQPSFNESVRGCDIFLIQSTFPSSDNLVELLLMIDAAKRASAHYITAVIPYFGMARQDRKDKPRVSIGSRVVADLLTTVGASRVITMDLHAPQIQGFFQIPVDHLDPSVIFIPYVKSLNIGSEIASMTLIGDVKGRHVVMVDDIIDTGNTLAKAAALLLDKGALSVRAMCTHPVLSGKAYETIENSVLTELVVCDTLPLRKESSKIKQLTTAALFADAIVNITEHGSISSLFEIKDNN
ncbi:MAG: ribose-phosphate pyrophosphokinase [Bacteroidetes bacterium]|nr:ribose-phosphate pyrophosphokinase [Bacteroidota bacterium]